MCVLACKEGGRVIVNKNTDCTTFHSSHLILLQATLRHGLVSLLLEGDDDQSHEYVYEEEREHHKVHHVEDGGLHAEAWAGTLVLIGGINRVFQDPERRKKGLI